MVGERLMESGPRGVASTGTGLTTTQPWLEGPVMADQEPTAARPFFKPLPEHDTLNTAYLLAKIAEQVVVSDRGCWEWRGAKSGDGYGRVEVGGRRRAIHRLVYSLCVAPLDKRVFVLHECDNPPCCRPDHLMVGTELTNLQDCVAKGRSPGGKLTAEQIEYIRQRAATGPRGIQRVLAKELGVSLTAITDVVRHQTHQHLSEDRWRSPEWAAFIKDWQQRLPEAMRRYRLDRGLDQKTLARLLSVSNSYVSRIEAGKVPAHPSTVVAFCKLAGFRVEGVA